MILNTVRELLSLNLNFIKTKINRRRERKELKYHMVDHASQNCVEEMYESYRPTFVLSTGRTGTKFLTQVLDMSASITAYHEPRPVLQYFCNYVYHNHQEEEIITEMINSARLELILDAYIKNKVYLETNQCLSFFASPLSKLFQEAKFIHLVRHPGDFVRSAVRKGWYKSDTLWEIGRIKKEAQEEWAEMNQIEKIAWLWDSTNQFIEDFKAGLDDKSRLLTVKSEEIYSNPDAINDILSFMEVDRLELNKIKQRQLKPVNKIKKSNNPASNINKKFNYPKYKEWQESKKDYLRKNVSLNKKYGYNL